MSERTDGRLLKAGEFKADFDDDSLEASEKRKAFHPNPRTGWEIYLISEGANKDKGFNAYHKQSQKNAHFLFGERVTREDAYNKAFAWLEREELLHPTQGASKKLFTRNRQNEVRKNLTVVCSLLEYADREKVLKDCEQLGVETTGTDFQIAGRLLLYHVMKNLPPF